MKKLTAEQLKETLERHRKHLLEEEGGKRADFATCNLYGADLRGADLYGADFRDADLRRADLRGANLGSADLRDTDLRGADLRRANLGSADLGSADLRGANLRRADLRRANLGSADLYGAYLYGADLHGADFRGAYLHGANLGSKTKIGRMLRLVGACQESVDWLDRQDHTNPAKLIEAARGDWRAWLTDMLGGKPSMERLQFVVDFIEGVSDE